MLDCHLELCSYPRLPVVPENKLLFLSGTKLVSPQEKEELENIKKEAENQSKGELPFTVKSWIGLLGEVSSSEVTLSLMVNTCVERQAWSWISFDEILDIIDDNRFYNSKIRSKERLKEELDYLHDCGYIRFLPHPDQKAYVTICPKIKEFLTEKHIILC